MNKYNLSKSAQHRNVKIYAELIGNYKNYRIKSLQDNRIDVEYGTGLFSPDGRKDVPWTYKSADGTWHQTSGQKPNPFLENAIEEKEVEIYDILAQAAVDEVRVRLQKGLKNV